MGYWDDITRRRVARRTALRGIAGAGLGAAMLSLIGCGGSSSTSSSSSSANKGTTSLLSKPEDTTSKIVRGGILPAADVTDTPGFNVYPSSAAVLTTHNNRAYSKLFNLTIANYAKGELPLTTVEGEALASYEVSPDGLQITGKLRPDMAFDQRAPTSGRKMTIDDVKFSWEKIKAVGKARGTLSNEVSPTAPITSITTPDDKTVVIKLAFPSPSILPNLGFGLNGAFIYPTEADGKYDPAKDMRGSGRWYLDKYEPSVGFQYRRNPNYFDKVRPYLDGIDVTIIPDYSNLSAQFRAGRINTFQIKPEDLVATKKDLPDTVLQQGLYSPAILHKVFFDFRPNSQWLDERLRQALSMTIDRDLLTESLNNVDGFRKEGIDMDVKWNSIVGVGEAEFWLDPKGSDFGPNAKYFKHDLAEATKLVKATGKDKIASPWVYPAPPQYGAPFQQAVQILFNMYNEGPFTFTANPRDYATDYSKRVIVGSRLTGGHDFEGVADGGVTSFPEVDSWMSAHFVPGGTFFTFEEGYPKPDDKWFSMIKAQQVEQDRKKRAEIIKDWQRYAAQTMFVIPASGQVPTFQIAWPWAGNFGAFATRGDTVEMTLWLDKSKMKS